LLLFHAPGILQIGTFALIAGLFVIGAVNMFTKVSGHLAVLSAFLTFAVLVRVGIVGAFYPIAITCLGKNQDKNHTLLQTVLGSVIGILTTVIIYAIVKYIVR